MAATAGSGSSGAGQQYPGDGNSEFDMIAFIVRGMLASLDTMKPVKVVAVHGGGNTVAAAGTVDVLPLVSQIDGSGNVTPHGTVYGLPWFRYQGGKNAVICDPVAGDFGFVLCADRDISSAKAAAAGGKDPQGAPGSRRRYNVADGIYVGGILSKDAPEQYIHFTEDKITIHDKTGNVVELSSAGIVLQPFGELSVIVQGSLIVNTDLLLGGNVLSQSGELYSGNFATSGEVTASGIPLSTHTHTQPNDSHGDHEEPTSPPVP